MSERLERFYEEAINTLRNIATVHGVEIPDGHACMENGVLHWRLSIFNESPEQYWADIWTTNAKILGLGSSIEPGDVVLDQEGRTWTLMGLDPAGMNYPVRLLSSTGEQNLASIEAARLFQLLVKKS